MPRGFGKGRSPSRFSFSYEDYASLLGCSTESIRKHAQRGNFDPRDLISVLEFIHIRLARQKDAQIMTEQAKRLRSLRESILDSLGPLSEEEEKVKKEIGYGRGNNAF